MRGVIDLSPFSSTEEGGLKYVEIERMRDKVSRRRSTLRFVIGFIEVAVTHARMRYLKRLKREQKVDD